MTSAFAVQLGQLAAASTNELDLRAQKAAHSQSLIFEPKVAGLQDFDTIYQLCIEGYYDLCQLDQRFCEFSRSIFSPQSKEQDRTQMTAQENNALSSVLEQLLALVGSRILLRPAIRAVEWLVRRFKVHTYNTSFLIYTFLPYHESPLFQNLLSILPTDLPNEHKFLGPYLKTATNPPRHAIVYNATNSDAFFSGLNTYALQAARQDVTHSLLLSFWTSITTEAVVARLALAQSGRKEIQQQRQQDVLLQVLPLLNNAFAIQEVPEMTIACYTISVILATKVDLADSVLDSLMEAIASTLPVDDEQAGLVCLSVLAENKSESTVSKKLLDTLGKVKSLEAGLRSVNTDYPTDKLSQALIQKALHSLKKKNYNERIQFIEKIIQVTKWRERWLNIMCQDTLAAIAKFNLHDSVHESIRTRLTEMLQRLCESEIFLAAVRQAHTGMNKNPSELESLLGQIVVDLPQIATQIEQNAEMDLETPEKDMDCLQNTLKHIPERTVNEHSFFALKDSQLFAQLLAAFQACCRQRDGPSKFTALPLWQTVSQIDSPLYLTFLTKVACGPYTPTCRSTALRLITLTLEGDTTKVDTQALLPYIISRIADESQAVRRAASNVIISMLKKAPTDLVEGESCRNWGSDGLYDANECEEVNWMSSSDLVKILEGALVPVLEECVADSTQILQTMRVVLTGSTVNSRLSSQASTAELKKGLRVGLFELLTTHLIATPLLTVKMDLIKLLDGVDKVGPKTKVKAIMPALHQWMSLKSVEAESRAFREQLQLSDVDTAMLRIISPTDKDVVSNLLAVLTDGKDASRPGSTKAVFARIEDIWKTMSQESRVAACGKLIEIALSGSGELSERARETLLSVKIPSKALTYLLHTTFTDTSESPNVSPSRKRRRSSSGQKSLASGINSVVSQMTLALELLDSSAPEAHPHLLQDLFQALAVLQSLKRQAAREFPYLLHLCLSSALAILQSTEASSKTRKELSAIRTELVSDCIQSSSSPQVQNAALLLMAEFARVVPEKILHNVMPIFTFMGNHALSKTDGHSVHVVNHTIDQIIPPMVRALQEQKKDATEGISEILSNFTAAFDHVAQGRRLALFYRLISRLEPNRVLHILVTMLIVRKSANPQVNFFVLDLLRNFPTTVQLRTSSDLLGQVTRLLQKQPQQAKMINGTDDITPDEQRSAVQSILSTVRSILKLDNLREQMAKSQRLGVQNSAGLGDEILNILQQLMQLGQESAHDEELGALVEHCTRALLDLLSLPEFLKLVSEILREDDAGRRQDALTMLDSRLLSGAANDSRSQMAAIDFLNTLASLIGAKEHDGVKHAAITCVDRISEKYGRKEPVAIVRIASVLTSDASIRSDKPSLQTSSLLCLASMVYRLKEAILPAVPEMMSKTLTVLAQSVKEEEEDERLHNAAYSALSALISNVPFLISETDVDTIFKLSAESANADLNPECQDMRRETLALLAQNIELKFVIPSLQRTWTYAVENDIGAAQQALSVLSKAIGHAGKADVTKMSEEIADTFTRILDLRRVQFTQRDEDSYTDEEVEAVEGQINEIAIKFIYKLNDTTFRPLLQQWIEWAVKCSGVPSTHLKNAKIMRQTTLFGLMKHFFATLQSIVTSYASYILEPAVEVLRSSSSVFSRKATMDFDQLALWRTSLEMVQQACFHDQDAFFASPSHFSPLAETLVSQLTLASTSSFQNSASTHVIPAIVALASATADTASHFNDINHHICQLRQSESAAVRMASIQTQQALTESDVVGEDWMHNIVRQGGETMVYVNEMLEDDDEDVEREVRKWVRRVGETTGEDVFET